MSGLERTDDFEAERGRVWYHRVRPATCGGHSQRQRGLLSAHTRAWHRMYVEYGLRGGLRFVQAVRHTEISSQSAHLSVRCAHSTSCFLTLPDLTLCQIENCHARVGICCGGVVPTGSGAPVLSTPILPRRLLLRRRHNHQFTSLCNAACTDAGEFVLMGFSKKRCLVVDEFEVRVRAETTR